MCAWSAGVTDGKSQRRTIPSFRTNCRRDLTRALIKTSRKRPEGDKGFQRKKRGGIYWCCSGSLCLLISAGCNSCCCWLICNSCCCETCRRCDNSRSILSCSNSCPGSGNRVGRCSTSCLDRQGRRGKLGMSGSWVLSMMGRVDSLGSS